MKKLLIIMLLSATPALAGSDGVDPHAWGMELSRADTAYRQGCISRRDRDEIWSAFEVLSEVTGTDWAKVKRIGKSYRYNSVNCDKARRAALNARIANAPSFGGTD